MASLLCTPPRAARSAGKLHQYFGQRRWWAWAAFLLLILFVCFHIVENWRGRKAWERTVAEFAQRGESFELASVIPPEIPDQQNFAAAPLFAPLFDFTYEEIPGDPAHSGAQPRDPKGKAALEAIRVAETDAKPPRLTGNWRQGELVPLEAWQTFYRGSSAYPKSPQLQTPAEDVLTALTRFAEPLHELELAAKRPRTRIPLRYDLGDQVPLTHLQVFSQSMDVLRLRASAELRGGNKEAAVRDLSLALRLEHALVDEPLSSFAAANAFESALAIVWEGLVQHGWDDEQLQAWENDLRSVNFIAAYQKSARATRNYVASRFEPQHFTRNVSTYLRDRPARVMVLAFIHAIPEGWLNQNRAEAMRLAQPWIDLADVKSMRIDPQQVERTKLWSASQPQGNPYTILARFTGASPYSLSKTGLAQATTNLARIAIALERHHLRHGSYPRDLAALDQDLAPGQGSWPLDPFSGTFPHYWPTDDGEFQLYYDGWNQTDDDGVSGWSDASYVSRRVETGDIVWPRLKREAQLPSPTTN